MTGTIPTLLVILGIPSLMIGLAVAAVLQIWAPGRKARVAEFNLVYAEAEVHLLSETLKAYADPAIWECDTIDVHGEDRQVHRPARAALDRGDRARAVLEALNELRRDRGHNTEQEG